MTGLMPNKSFCMLADSWANRVAVHSGFALQIK